LSAALTAVATLLRGRGERGPLGELQAGLLGLEDRFAIDGVGQSWWPLSGSLDEMLSSSESIAMFAPAPPGMKALQASKCSRLRTRRR
jgi:hypothetical protein